MSIPDTVQQLAADASVAQARVRAEDQVHRLVDAVEVALPDKNVGEVMVIMADTLGRMIRRSGLADKQAAFKAIMQIVALKAFGG